MTKTIQIENVPEALLRTLEERAAVAGLSLSDYVVRELEESAARPSLEESDASAAAHGRPRLRSGAVVSAIRDARED